MRERRLSLSVARVSWRVRKLNVRGNDVNHSI
jgi:hypothetical protein